MKIKDVEEITKLTRANIRFYEQKGLLKPGREENNYKEYTEEDVITLKKIVLLRKLDISIENIQLILDGKKTLLEVLQSTQIDLMKQIAELNGALEMCNCMQEKEETIEHMDTEYYLNMIMHKEEEGKKFKNLMEDIFEDYQTNLLEKIYGQRLGKSLFIVLGLSCICFVIINQYILHTEDSVLFDFLMPLIVFMIISAIYFLIKIIGIKSKKLAKELSKIIMGVSILITIIIGILILVTIFDKLGIHLFGIWVNH
ncbi:DNA-binding transcriptional MerR regulator [Mobilisporobacter senegalensis]|uniref:DNA-binding transcriptional MerR regulator n=1 Tax=Mobilisporobacter senegalensis TaxID=1329262 RepID=A0A3N1XKR2_9FIRM|nr:MerR family transcriptional regulator [Mobilisporobacter senegalensis]ROR25652.1 DNA-binding transcriptional MerR regulator [Mobilisporobacter senegalensis]